MTILDVREIFYSEVRAVCKSPVDWGNIWAALERAYDRIAPMLKAEPQPMSREKMVKVVADHYANAGIPDGLFCAKTLLEGNRDGWMEIHGALTAIDALAGRILAIKTDSERFDEHLEQASETVAGWPACKQTLLGAKPVANDEAAEWKQRYERQLAHASRLQTTCGKKSGEISEQARKILELEYEIARLKQQAGPDRLYRICELLGKLSRAGEAYPKMQIFEDRRGTFRVDPGGGRVICTFRPGEDPEKVLASYVAGHCSDSLRAELDTLGDMCPEIKAIVRDHLDRK